MKKLYFSIVLFLILIIPSGVLAYQEGITSFYIDATVKENGDMHVKELIILNGEFNGFDRIINYSNNRIYSFDGTLNSFYGSDIYNANDIELISIKDIAVDHNSGFDVIFNSGNEFNRSFGYDVSVGDYGKYVIYDQEFGYRYRIYNPSNGKERGFYIEYLVKDSGVVHEDIAEVYMNLFDELTEYVNKLEMHIHIPGNKELLRAWAHGPLTGNILIEDKETIKVTASNIPANTAIDVRFAFDKNILSNSKKFSKVEALNKIIEVETKRADEANAEREEMLKLLTEQAIFAVELAEQTPNRSNYNDALEAINYLPETEVKTLLLGRLDIVYKKIIEREQLIKTIYTFLLSAWLVGLVLLIRSFYNKYDKEYEAKFKGDYYRDFPANYGPEIVGYLFNKSVSNNDLSACLMNLIYKKVVTYKEQSIGKGNKKTYLLTPHIEGKELNNQEKQLIDFLLGGKPVTLDEIQKKAKRNYQSFISGFSKWKNLTIEAGENENFFEHNKGRKTLYILYCILGFIVAIITGFNPYQSFVLLDILVILVAIFALIYFASSTKRTIKGNEDYRRWLGLKRFLKDFSNMDKRKLPEVELWEKYLVYALPLGCAKQLAKDMEIRIKDFATDNVSNLPFDLDYMHRVFIINNIVNQSITSSVSAAYSEKSRQEMSDISSSSSSSGGGFGGGFSGGGGFGGGGGGGGRF